MARVSEDPQLCVRLQTFIRSCGGNRSLAARRMGVNKMLIQGVLARNCRVHDSTRIKLGEGLDRAEAATHAVPPGLHNRHKTHQTSDDMMRLAAAVARTIAEAVEREINGGAR
jgi:hypothetical protein